MSIILILRRDIVVVTQNVFVEIIYIIVRNSSTLSIHCPSHWLVWSAPVCKNLHVGRTQDLQRCETEMRVANNNTHERQIFWEIKGNCTSPQYLGIMLRDYLDLAMDCRYLDRSISKSVFIDTTMDSWATTHSLLKYKLLR